MYKVLLTPYREELGKIYHRQTIGHKLISQNGKYQFFIGDGVDDPDFWVVQGKGLRVPKTCRVAKANTIMLATEPQSVLVYPNKYLNQFGLICTCQENTRHKNMVLGPAILPWFVGFSEDERGCSFTLDYDGLVSSPAPNKTKLMSVITSNKAFTKGHLDRIRFVERLKEHFGDQLDIFGRGFRSFDDKWDVLAPYKYHIAIENSSQSYYWTEKISDCYLAQTFPFYYGCTNLNEYFPEKAFIAIDLNDWERSIDTIENAINNGVADENAFILNECKQLVLKEYNIFDYIAKLCDTLDPGNPKSDITLQPCHSMDDWHNVWHYTVTRNFFKLRMKFMNEKHLSCNED